MKKSIIKIASELGRALEEMDEAYMKYLAAVRNASEKAKELEKASKEAISKPYIEIGDFEIDN